MVILTPTIEQEINAARQSVVVRNLVILILAISWGIDVFIHGFFAPRHALMAGLILTIIAYNTLFYFLCWRLRKSGAAGPWFKKPNTQLVIGFALDIIIINLLYLADGDVDSFFMVALAPSLFYAFIAARPAALIALSIEFFALFSVVVFLYSSGAVYPGAAHDTHEAFQLLIRIPVAALLLLILYFIAENRYHSKKSFDNECRRQFAVNTILLNSVDESVLILDAEDRVSFINDSACRFFGTNYDKAMGKPVAGLLDPKTGKGLVQKLKDSPLAFRKRLEIITLSGRSKPVSITASRLEKDDEPGLIVIIDETTGEREKEKQDAIHAHELELLNEDLKNAQLASLNILEDVERARVEIDQEKTKLQSVIQGVADGIIVIDRNSKLIMLNSAAERMAGISAEKVRGENYHNYFSIINEETGEVKHAVHQKPLAGNMVNIRSGLALLKKNGEKLPVSVSGVPIRAPGGAVMSAVIVFRDITVEREIDRRKTEFISVASHQLRTPLSAMKWFLEMLITGDAGQVNAEQKDYLKQVFDSNERMIELVNDLLNVSRIEAGRVGIDAVPTDYIKMVESIIDGLKPKMADKKINYLFTKPRAVRKMKLDPKLLREAIANVLDNAIKYSPPGTLVKINMKVAEPDVLLSIADQGYGIPVKEQENIFTKFFRASNVIKQVTEGTGLGLYLSKSVVESMGGKIWFESRAGKGTTFYISLPMEGVRSKEGETSIL